jgi:DNA-binding response OmpR family regulator
MNFPNRVLIVEDNPLHLDILERAFSTAGAVAVVKASDGYEATSLLFETSSPFDLIILDLCLPGLDGFEMLNHLNDCGSDTRFVLLSGMPQHMLDMGETFSEMKGLRIIGALQKPISISELMNVVQSQDWTDHPTLTGSPVLQAG